MICPFCKMPAPDPCPLCGPRPTLGAMIFTLVVTFAALAFVVWLL